MTVSGRISVWARPVTRAGRLAAGLATVFLAMIFANFVIGQLVTIDPVNGGWQGIVLPIYLALMELCGLAAGALGLRAVLRWRERSWFVWLAILVGLLAALMLLDLMKALVSR